MNILALIPERIQVNTGTPYLILDKLGMVSLYFDFRIDDGRQATQCIMLPVFVVLPSPLADDLTHIVKTTEQVPV